MRRSAATVRAAGRAADRSPAIRRCRWRANASPIMSHAPAELLRRLKQVAVVDEDEDQPLAVGQRLVTRDGRLRRWDGFVAAGAGAAAAERLLRANRLSELAAELPALEQAVADALAERDRRAGGDGTVPRAAPRQRAHAALAAERDARDAGRAIDAATAALERIEAQRAGLASAWRISIRSSTRLGTPWPRPSGRLRPCPIRRRSRSRSAGARGVAASAASAVADKRAEAATKARETAADRERSSAAATRAGRVAHARRPRPSSGMRRRSSARSSRGPSAPSSEREPAELDPADRAQLERANNESQVQIGEAASAEREAEEAVVAAARQVAAANERSADTRERRAAAAARAEAQQARSAEFARASVDKFECVPQRLPEKLGFDADEDRAMPMQKRRRSSG